MTPLLLWFDALPWGLKVAILFGIGLFLGRLVNHGTYAWAWNRREIGPSLPKHPDAPPRQWLDRIPVFGWWTLRRESKVHGGGYWIRPLLVELLFPFALVLLYAWEMGGGITQGITPDPVLGQQRFLLHAALLVLMTIATLIDLDEKTIPDEVTIGGTAMALLMAASLSGSRLPSYEGLLQVASPEPWPVALHQPWGLYTGLACLWFWCAALLTPRRLWWKRGIGRAMRYLIAGVFRYPYWWWVLGIGLAGSIAAGWTWRSAGPAWESLYSSLVGLAFGTALVWLVRLIATRALGREALGFGDVTLMAMIGAFLGWQPAMIVFFLAPFVGVVVAVVQWLATRNPEIAYGPYLCLATAGIVVGWSATWARWGSVFILGWTIPAILAACLVLMGVLLMGWRTVRDRF